MNWLDILKYGFSAVAAYIGTVHSTDMVVNKFKYRKTGDKGLYKQYLKRDSGKTIYWLLFFLSTIGAIGTSIWSDFILDTEKTKSELKTEKHWADNVNRHRATDSNILEGFLGINLRFDNSDSSGQKSFRDTVLTPNVTTNNIINSAYPVLTLNHNLPTTAYLEYNSSKNNYTYHVEILNSGSDALYGIDYELVSIFYDSQRNGFELSGRQKATYAKNFGVIPVASGMSVSFGFGFETNPYAFPGNYYLCIQFQYKDRNGKKMPSFKLVTMFKENYLYSQLPFADRNMFDRIERLLFNEGDWIKD